MGRGWVKGGGFLGVEYGVEGGEKGRGWNQIFRKKFVVKVQKLMKWCHFWIQKLLKNINFWIQKSAKWTFYLLDPEIDEMLQFLDPEIAEKHQFLDPEIGKMDHLSSGSRN